MKFFLHSVFLCFILFASFSLLSLSVSADSAQGGPSDVEKVTIVYETLHNPPRALGRGTAIDWDKPGLTLELLRLVEQRLNIKFHFIRRPWKRGLYLLEKNEVDGIFHASFKKSREALGVYPKKDGEVDQSRSIFYQSYALYKRDDSAVEFHSGQVTNLDGSIGAMLDYAIADDLKKKGYEVTQLPTQATAFQRLSKGRIAAFAHLENMADDFLARNNDRFNNITKVSPPLKSKAYYLIFSHGFVDRRPELAQQIWNVIGEINNSKRFKELANNY